MYILKTNTATRIAVGPLVDPTDGKTAETGLTVTDLSVQIYQLKNDGGAVTRSQFSPTASSGNNDMVLVASSTDGMYDLELTAAQLNFLGNARISFYDIDGFWFHYIDVQVVSAAYFDLIYGSTNLSVLLANGAHGGAAASLNLGAGATISNTDGHALTLTGGTNGHGLLASGAGTGSGLVGSGGSGGGHGLYAVGDDSGMGIYAVGGDAALALTAGMLLKSNASTNPVGLYVEDGAIITDDAGTALMISSTGNDGAGVELVGNGTGGDLVADITGNLSGSIGSVATNGITAASLDADASSEINTAVLAAISGIGTAGGAAINVDAATDNVSGGITGVTSGTTFVGTQASGTFANTANVNATYHRINGTGSTNTVFDVVYQFLLGSGTNPVQATWVGIMNSSDDTLVFDVWRHDTNAWEPTVSTVTGTNAATVQTKNITLYARHRGTSAAELGKVYIRLKCTGTLTPTVYTDQLVVSYAVTSRGTYSDGAVWLNTAASNTNTQSYVDGLPENPVSTIAAAITIATALNLKRYRVANGSAITLAADHTNRTMLGHGYTLALGTQNISGSYFEGVEGLSGTATCPTAEAIITDCHLNAVTIGEADFVRCHLMNTVTLSQASVPYRFHDCTGVTSAKITFAAANQSAVISKVSGVLTIAGMVSTNTLYIDGNADVTFDNTNNTGTVYIAGSIRLTNNGVTMNITDTARWSEDQSVAGIGSGGITSSSFATGAITATSIAADAIGASELAADAANEIADAILARNVSGGSSTGRLVKEALHVLRNKVEVSDGTMTVYDTDDASTSWTAVVTGTEGADPITTINPA